MNRNRNRMTWRAAVITFTLFSFSEFAISQTTIAWKLNEGDRLYLQRTEDARQTVRLLGAETLQSVRTKKVVRYDVLRKDKDGSLSLAKTIESIQVEYKGGAKHGDHSIVKALKDARFQFTLTPTGAVKDYSGFAVLLKKLKNAGQGSLVKMLKATMSNDSLRAADAAVFDITPDKPVSPGDRWERSPTEPLGPFGSLQLHTFYTLTGKQKADGTVEIVKSSTMSYRKPAKINRDMFPIEGGRLTSAIEKGMMSFNVAVGRLQKAKWRRAFTGTFTLKMNGKESNMIIEHRQDTTLLVSDSPPTKK